MKPINIKSLILAGIVTATSLNAELGNMQWAKD